MARMMQCLQMAYCGWLTYWRSWLIDIKKDLQRLTVGLLCDGLSGYMVNRVDRYVIYSVLSMTAKDGRKGYKSYNHIKNSYL
jgi:hypothetical protein